LDDVKFCYWLLVSFTKSEAKVVMSNFFGGGKDNTFFLNIHDHDTACVMAHAGQLLALSTSDQGYWLPIRFLKEFCHSYD